jgi:hypothetical protein
MTMRRRSRRPDPLASVSEIREVIGDLRRRCPELVPASERGLLRLINAVRHVERRSTGASKSGRPDHFPRKKLFEVSLHLKAVLAKRYRDRISLGTLTHGNDSHLWSIVHKCESFSWVYPGFNAKSEDQARAA